MMKAIKLTLKPLVILITILFMSNILLAQHGRETNRQDESRERIEAHKVAFLTERLDLSPSEAEEFWPVYNENKSHIENQRKEFQQSHNYTSENIKHLSDNEAENLINVQIDHEQQMLEMKRMFYSQMRSVLSPQKLLALIEAEKEFRVELMKKVARRDARDDGNSRDEHR